MLGHHLSLFVVAACFSLAGCACSSSKKPASATEEGSETIALGDPALLEPQAADAGVLTDAGSDASSPFVTNSAGQVVCKDGLPCACDDGIDNDSDGKIDGFDSECTGPYDDDEATFATGIPGDNMDPKKQDCFFDGDSGQGNDKCVYTDNCMSGTATCNVSQACIDFCAPRTPNGCDCFGCCLVFDGQGGSQTVGINGGCSLSDLTGCSSCVQSTQCVNTCGACEVCLGHEPEPSCSSGGGGGPAQSCPNGEVACDETHPCSDGLSWCQSGCCVARSRLL